jgi:hypothetical protein
MKKIILTLAVITLSVSVFAESKASPEVKKVEASSIKNMNDAYIHGIVTDKNSKESLAGVAVECEGQKTYTDLEGNFTLRKPLKSTEVVLSMISYEVQKIKIENDTELSIQLRQR